MACVGCGRAGTILPYNFCSATRLKGGTFVEFSECGVYVAQCPTSGCTHNRSYGWGAVGTVCSSCLVVIPVPSGPPKPDGTCVACHRSTYALIKHTCPPPQYRPSFMLAGNNPLATQTANHPPAPSPTATHTMVCRYCGGANTGVFAGCADPRCVAYKPPTPTPATPAPVAAPSNHVLCSACFAVTPTGFNHVCLSHYGPKKSTPKPKPPPPRRNCYECGAEWCEYLDGCYSKDPWVASKCVKCRGRDGRGGLGTALDQAVGLP